jgi:Protein of unknown function (DUF2012)
MVMSIYRCLMLVAAIAYAASSSVQVSIATLPVDGELDIPTGELASNIQVTLNGGEFSAISRIDGRFTFHDVPTGVYLLDVLSIHHVFSQMKIKVAAEEGVINVVEFKYPGAMRMQTSKIMLNPIQLNSIPSIQFSSIIILINH